MNNIYKSLHMADIHMSNSLPYAKPYKRGTTDRILDQVKVFLRIFEAAKKYNCEEIFIQGDLFDHSKVDAITLTTTIKTLAKSPVPIYILPGNHDGINTRGERFVTEAFSEIPNVHCLETGVPFEVNKWLNFWPLEFASLDISKQMIKKMKLNKSKTNVLLMHNSVEGCVHFNWVCQKGFGLSPKSLMNKFDYVISGHFHKPQSFVRNLNGIYLGAPMHHRFDDVGRDAGFWIMEWKKGGFLRKKFIDGGAPKFHFIDFNKKEERTNIKDIRGGDFVRVNFRSSHSRFIAKKHFLERYVEKLKQKGIRASWYHDPIHKHSNRIYNRDNSEMSSVRDTIKQYIDADEIDIGGFNKNQLLKVGYEIFDKAKLNWSDIGIESYSRLIDIQGKNFAAFKDFKFKLSNQGLVCIQGNNKDTTASKSNGACKTGLFKAIGWCLYGESIDNQSGDKVIRKGTKKASVCIRVKSDKDIYRIRRERHKKSPKLYIERNNNRVSLPKKELQQYVNRLIGVDWSGFKNTSMYGQMDRDRFIYPTTKDNKRKSILHHMLRTHIYEYCFEVVKKERLIVSKKIDKIQVLIDSYYARINDIDISSIVDEKDKYNKNKKNRVAVCKSEIKGYKIKLKKVWSGKKITGEQDKYKDKLKKLELLIDNNIARQNGINGEMEFYEKERLNYFTSIASVESKLESINEKLNLLKGNKCPTCTSSLKKDKGKAYKSGLVVDKNLMMDELAGLKKGKEWADLRLDELISSLDVLKNKSHQLGRKLTEIKYHLNYIANVKNTISVYYEQIDDKKKELKKIENEKNPYELMISKSEKKIKVLKGKLKELKNKLMKLKNRKNIFDFWVRAFSPKGIPSFVLDSVMPFITSRANHYLDILSDGDMSIEFNSQKKLPSGEYKDEIDISWLIEGLRDYPPSGAQWKKMEIAANFSLMDLISSRERSSVNILCLDECLDGLDIEGRQRVISMLHSIRNERESIFVISHDPELSEIFERTFLVVKKNGVSNLTIIK